MRQKLRPRLTYANVTATMALFVALGGTGAYATHLVVNSSDVVNESLLSQDVKGKDGTATTAAVNGTLTGADISGQPAQSSVGQPFVDGSLTTSDIKNQSLTGFDIKDGWIGAADLAYGAVTTEKLAVTPPPVQRAHIREGAVDSVRVADESLTGVDLANGAVDSAKVADNSLTGADIANDGLTGDDIAESTLQGVRERCLVPEERILGDLCVFTRGNQTWSGGAFGCSYSGGRLPTFGEAIHIAVAGDVPWVGEPGAARWFWTDEFTRSGVVWGVEEDGSFLELGAETNSLAVICVEPRTDRAYTD
jgi:hypothetical protein